MSRPIKLFFSYSHRDEALRDQLAIHLATLQRRDVIDAWHDRKIGAGADWAKDISDNLRSADIILLLISPDFLHSDYCSVTELEQAMERHKAGEACVIPVILRPSDWQEEPFARLQALPKNAKPITTWNDRDEAFLDVVRGIRGAVQALSSRSIEPTQAEVDRETTALTTEIKTSGHGEEQYRDEVLFCLKQDAGEISEISRVILNGLQESLELSIDRAKAIEAEVARPFQIFRQTVIDLNVRSITPEIKARLDRLQQTLKLSDEDVEPIKTRLLATKQPENEFTQREEDPTTNPGITEPETLPLWTRREFLITGGIGSVILAGITIGNSGKTSELINTTGQLLNTSSFSFDVVTVDAQGKEIDRQRRQAKYFAEDLGNGVTLEMVSIPAGEFLMGSPESEKERFSDESPQHSVKVPSFFMGKFEVTQAQWAVVTKLPKVKIDLNPDPSNFKGAKRPIEQVSWFEAVEFCDRLSRKTGQLYRLPSEAEWEYACRAGTTTPFHFGETITTDLVNFDGNYNYASAPKGKYLERTTDVGSFPPNAFGLYDMHGNVWEWCFDHWHEKYNGAPTDGSAWLSNDENASRVLRGGSWRFYPRRCRSASRVNVAAGSRLNLFGFRVVCLAPRTL